MPAGNHYRGFDKAFFAKHQRVLLWFLNAPLVRVWSRWVLRIRPCDLPLSRRIFEIQPNHYKVLLWSARGRSCFRADFRTNDKYARRLYHAFRPLWWAMHAWDLVADLLFPRFSFGFSTLTAYPDAGIGGPTGSATVERSTTAESMATIRAGAGTYVSSTDNPNNIAGFQTATSSSPNLRALDRAHFTFDTSGLTSFANISAAVFSLYGSAKNDDGTAVSPDVNVYAATPSADYNFVTTDYGQIGTTAQCDSPVTYSGWSTAGYNDFTLNSTGRGNISKTGHTKFGTRNANYDVANVAPTYSSNTGHFLQAYLAQETGTTKDPKLVVTYTIVTVYTRTMADSFMNASSRTASVSRVKKAIRAKSDSLMNAASRLATLARKYLANRAASDSLMNAAGRTSTLARMYTAVRTPSATLMNAASRLATVSRSFVGARAMSDSLMNAASRFATVAKAYVREMTDSLMNAASRLQSVTRMYNAVRAPSEAMMNAASRFITVTKHLYQNLSDSLMNSASRLATVSRIRTVVRGLSDSLMYAAGRYARRLIAYVNGLDARYGRKYSAQNPSYDSKYPSNPGSYSDKYESRDAIFEKKYPDP